MAGNGDQEAVLDLGRRWAEAEVARDLATLDDIAVAEFRLVGPAGFVLERDAWMARYRPEGGLETTELAWKDVDVRIIGDTAVAIGTQDQRATYHGNRVDGRFRGTHVYLRRDGRWWLAGVHLSPQQSPPAPPSPGP